MKTPQWAAKIRATNPRAYYSVLTLLAAVVMTNLVLVAFVVKMDPRVIGDLLQAVILLCIAGGMLRLSERVSRLEKEHTAPGGFTALVADAKAAAKLAGNTEEQSNAVANEVLATSIRQAGGWKV